jgi:hypothetical protein
MIQGLVEPYVAREIAEQQPDDALLLYREDAGSDARAQVQKCVGSSS